MRDDGYEACSTERVDMRRRIIERMVSSPDYMAAIPLTVADLRAEGDDEGAGRTQSPSGGGAASDRWHEQV